MSALVVILIALVSFITAVSFALSAYRGKSNIATEILVIIFAAFSDGFAPVIENKEGKISDSMKALLWIFAVIALGIGCISSILIFAFV